MRTNYSLTSDWYVEGEITEVADILGDVPSYTRWWSPVYKEVTVVEPGDENEVGKVIDVHTKGWLPYTLRWRAHVTESRYPYGFSIDVSGDFVGDGVWTLEEQGSIVHARFTWTVDVTKPLLRSFSFLLRPIFTANHRWAMSRGEEGLKRELDRRRDEEIRRSDETRAPGGQF